MEKCLIKYFVTKSGREPFVEWLDGLETTSQVVVIKYVNLVACGGSLKNIRYLKNGVFEIKIRYAAGLRVFFAKTESKDLLLLTGGDKGSQKSDITKAVKYWRNYGAKK